MLNISRSGNISINRGDTFKIPLFIDCSKDIFNSIRFPMQDGDEVYFYLVEPNTSFKCPLIKQIYTKEDTNENGDVILKFAHKDTNWIVPGTYYYEIKVRRKLKKGFEDALITVATRRKFIVM